MDFEQEPAIPWFCNQTRQLSIALRVKGLCHRNALIVYTSTDDIQAVFLYRKGHRDNGERALASTEVEGVVFTYTVRRNKGYCDHSFHPMAV